MKLPVNKHKVNPKSPVSGNINWNELFRSAEKWTYSSADTVSADGFTATDILTATVAVQPSAVVKVSGGQLSKTAMPWYRIFPAGADSALAGLEVFKAKRGLTLFESAQVYISGFFIVGSGFVVLWVGLIFFAFITFASIGAE